MSDRIRAALATLDAALSKLKRRPKPRKPASAAAIAKLEAAWSRALPPSLNLFDLGAITERDNNGYAPCARWIDALLPPTQLAFSTDSKSVTDAGAVAFDVATGEPCAPPASHATGAAIKLSNRFSRRDGIRLPSSVQLVV